MRYLYKREKAQFFDLIFECYTSDGIVEPCGLLIRMERDGEGGEGNVPLPSLLCAVEEAGRRSSSPLEQ